MPLTPVLSLPAVPGCVLPAPPQSNPQHPHLQLPLKHQPLLLLPLPAVLWNLLLPTIAKTGQLSASTLLEADVSTWRYESGTCQAMHRATVSFLSENTCYSKRPDEQSGTI